MYLRHTARRKVGKIHVDWQLVRSVRRGRKVVQQTVAQLGELDGEGRARAEALARSIAGHAREHSQGQLFDGCEPTGSVAVKLERVRLERSRSFGAVWVGWILWRALKLEELCNTLLACKRETVSWGEVVAILVIGRLCEPSSELHVAERWYRSTALEDLLGVSTEDIYDERLYRALDRLLPHKAAVEKHLVKRPGELFDLDYDLLLYDVTSTYFEGVADPSIAKRGYSRDHRPDCAGEYCAGGEPRRDAAGLRDFCRQHHRCHHRPTDCPEHGESVWQNEPGMGNGPRDGECGEHCLAELNGSALCDRYTASGATSLCQTDRGKNRLAPDPRRYRSKNLWRT